MSFKRYRQHGCGRKHRMWLTAAKCIWPRAVWVTGEGPYASVAYCRALTVMLFDDPDDAVAAKAFIDKFGCGGMCHRSHEIIQLTPEARGA